MRMGLATAAAVPLLWATAATAQMKGLVTQDVASVAKARALDLRLSEEVGGPRPIPLMRGLIVSRDLAPNASVGVGLANIYDRRRGSEFRGSDQPRRSTKPAVTFVLKF
jgi:hypothetical protein